MYRNLIHLPVNCWEFNPSERCTYRGTKSLTPPKTLKYKYCTEHIICQNLSSSHALQGTAVLPKQGHDLILGEERWEKKSVGKKHKKIYIQSTSHKFGMCKGAMETIDNGCWLKCGIRELSEEFKIVLTVDQFVQRIEDIVISCGMPIILYNAINIDFDDINKRVKNSIIESIKTGINNSDTEINCLKKFPISMFRLRQSLDIQWLTYNSIRELMKK